MPDRPFSYENVDLHLTQDGEIRATSPQGEVGPVRLRLDRDDLVLKRKLVEEEAATPELVAQLGQLLYQALFPAPILALVERSRVAAPERHLRFRLHLESDSLVALPWELVHDGQAFLSLRPDTSIVRYPEASKAIQPLPVEGPLRVLVVIASPVNLPSFQPEVQARELTAILGGLQTRGLLEVEFLTHATYVGLMRRLRTGGFHVLHFLGYSAFDAATQQPVLLFEEENGLARRVSGDDLRGLILRKGVESVLRLVLIHDCEGPAGSGSSFALGVAQRLVQLGLPAVLTVQYSLPDRVLREFAAEVYSGIASGLPLDAAVQRGRKGISQDIDPAASGPLAGRPAPGEWAGPVLLMRSEDGQIFRPRPFRQVAFAQPAGPLQAEIGGFQFQTDDWLTRLALNHLWLITLIAILALAAGQGFGYLRLDPMYVSVIAVVFGCLWLLRSLSRKTVPDTFKKVWRRNLLVARDDGSLARHYLDFLRSYNALLNDRRYGWITRLIGLMVAIVTWVGLWYPGLHPLDLVGLLYLLVGYVLGAQLWTMIATMIATRQLGARFDLDVHPTRPDGCGGLKPLGDLYFANARVVLLAGLLVAAWVLDLSLSAAFLERHIARQIPEQARLMQYYLDLCRGRQPSTPPPAEDLAAVLPGMCDCMADWRMMEGVDLTPRARVLYCIVRLAAQPEQSPLVNLTWQTMRFYPWLPLFQALLVILALVAILTFFFPMLNTHHTLSDMAPRFQRRADSLEAEMVELERYLEQYGPANSEEGEEISDRLEWLREHYQKYSKPPLWPFDFRVKMRMAGSLGMMVASLLISQILPGLIETLNRFLLQ
jgi:hypothetical protein